MPGKDSSHPLGMTMPVISNEVRDLSPILFSKEHTKATKNLRINTLLNFVLFATFVVKFPSPPWLWLCRARPIVIARRFGELPNRCCPKPIYRRANGSFASPAETARDHASRAAVWFRASH